MKKREAIKFNSIADLYRWCQHNHGDMIDLRQFKKINENIANLGVLGECAGLHIPYVEQGVKRYIMPMIKQGKVQHIIPDDNSSYIHLIDASCLAHPYKHKRRPKETKQYIDYSVYFRLSPDGYMKTSMKLRSTIQDFSIKGRMRSIWVGAELLEENY